MRYTQPLRDAAAALAGALLLLAGCSRPVQPRPAAPQPAATAPKPAPPQRADLARPLEQSLLALKAMNAAGNAKDLATAQAHFREYLAGWAAIRKELEPVDPRLAQHITDGGVELEHEFGKPAGEIRIYELDEETIKLGRLLTTTAEVLNIPLRPELVQAAPTAQIPYNQEVRVEVSLSEHKILPEVITLDQHTKVTFVITNKGRETHEFSLGHYAAEVEEIKPGETRELTLVVLDAGEFETACHLPGHYEVGMHGKLVVQPSILRSR
jgi:uncharacterized cupredoxin-like copper-binding protein